MSIQKDAKNTVPKSDSLKLKQAENVSTYGRNRKRAQLFKVIVAPVIVVLLGAIFTTEYGNCRKDEPGNGSVINIPDDSIPSRAVIKVKPTPTPKSVPVDEEFRTIADRSEGVEWVDEGNWVTRGDKQWLKETDLRMYTKVKSYIYKKNKENGDGNAKWRLPTLGELGEVREIIQDGLLPHREGDRIWTSESKPYRAFAGEYHNDEPFHVVELLDRDLAYIRLVREIDAQD